MVKIMVTVVFFMVVGWSKYATSYIFTAISDLESLLKTHQGVVEDIEGYIKEQVQRLVILKKYVTQYKNEHRMMKTIPNHWVNPLASFVLIKRLTFDLQNLDELMVDQVKVQQRKGIPTAEDLEGATDALLRLQQTYLLNTTHLANGTIKGTFSSGKARFTEHVTPLTAHDCLTIGARASNNSRKLEWILEAHHKYIREETDNKMFEASLVDVIRKTYLALKDFGNAILWTEKLIQLQPENKKELTHDLNIYRSSTDQILNLPLAANETLQWKYEALCRGEIPLPEDLKKNLLCYYKSGPKPFLKIAPIRAEQLLFDPVVIMYHDVITDDEINVIMDLVRPAGFESSGLSLGKKEETVFRFRVSKHSWINQSSEVALRISKRIEDFTGLSLETAEYFQVANYGLGGHYDRHFDYLNEIDEENGNRIATVLFYFSEVEQGGATVFLNGPGLTVYPKKRAAIFWYNTVPSGDRDNLTLHAACPVLRGSKWMATKWIHEVGQEFRQGCALNRFEKNRFIHLKF